MDNMFFAKAGVCNIFKCDIFKKVMIFSVLWILSLLFYGCASSDVSRQVSSNIDVGVQNTLDRVNYSASTNVADSYQNASQLTKGAILGGAAGALTGYVYSSAVGVLPGALVGALLGASYGSYIDSKTTIEDQIRNRGGTIVLIGDQILIVIPSWRIFDVRSAKIKTDAFSTLKLIARYINGYTKTLVKISVYTDGFASREVNLSTSQEQADSLEHYFAVGGLDARMISAFGYGCTHLVQSPSLAWDGNDNYRIEFTFEKLYV